VYTRIMPTSGFAIKRPVADQFSKEILHYALLVHFTMYQKMCSFRIFGDLVNYTFLETLKPTESEKQCLHFSKHPVAAILDFQNGDCFFLKSGNISAYKHHRHLILVSKHTFSTSRILVAKLIRF